MVAEEARRGILVAKGAVFSDSAPPTDFPIPITTASRSRLRFLATVTGACFTHTHFLYDFLGMARAHGWLPLFKRPFMTMVCGIEAWPGGSSRSDRVKTARQATMLVAISAHTRARASELDATFARAKVCWLATLEDDLPVVSRRLDKSPRVVILARLDADGGYKGHKELIACWPKVVAAVSDATLIVAGYGPGADLLRDLAARSTAAKSIEFIGRVPEENKADLWARSTVVAMPSRGEGFGLVYVEAMRYGVPVIASIHDAGQEINLDGETGYNVNMDRPDELPERLVQLLQNPDHAGALGANGQKRWLEHFRYSAFRDRFRPILQEFLEL